MTVCNPVMDNLDRDNPLISTLLANFHCNLDRFSSKEEVRDAVEKLNSKKSYYYIENTVDEIFRMYGDISKYEEIEHSLWYSYRNIKNTIVALERYVGESDPEDNSKTPNLLKITNVNKLQWFAYVVFILIPETVELLEDMLKFCDWEDDEEEE